MSVGTAFHPRTAPLNRKMQWREWAGYFASSVYADFHDIEYNAIREAAAVIDVSPLYKYRVTGPDVIRLADRVITRDATKLQGGAGLLHALVRRARQGHRRRHRPPRRRAGAPLDRGRSAVPLADAERRRPGRGHRGRHRGARRARAPGPLQPRRPRGRHGRGLRGPRATSAAARATIAGVPIDVSRTGYTGDLGYELWIPADAAPAVWDALFEAGKATRSGPRGCSRSTSPGSRRA